MYYTQLFLHISCSWFIFLKVLLTFYQVCFSFLNSCFICSIWLFPSGLLFFFFFQFCVSVIEIPLYILPCKLLFLKLRSSLANIISQETKPLTLAYVLRLSGCGVRFRWKSLCCWTTAELSHQSNTLFSKALSQSRVLGTPSVLQQWWEEHLVGSRVWA